MFGKSAIIFTHKNGCGGAGDLLRGMLSCYAFAVENNIDFYVDFNENENLKQCFEYNTIEYNINNCTHHRTTGGIYNKEYSPDNYKLITDLLDNIINNPNIYIIKSNAIGYVDANSIRLIKNKFFTEILRPSIKVKNNLENIYNKYNLCEKSYISIHVRCGDYNMENSVGTRDNRINIDMFDISHLDDFIERTIFKIPGNENKKLILHSDSVEFKNLIKQRNKYTVLDINIKHIAENFGVNDEQSFVDTISELYFISQAHAIIMPFVYTGFSHIASVINSVPLYTNVRSLYFSYFHDNNVFFVD